MVGVALQTKGGGWEMIFLDHFMLYKEMKEFGIQYAECRNSEIHLMTDAGCWMCGSIVNSEGRIDKGEQRIANSENDNTAKS